MCVNMKWASPDSEWKLGWDFQGGFSLYLYLCICICVIIHSVYLYLYTFICVFVYYCNSILKAGWDFLSGNCAARATSFTQVMAEERGSTWSGGKAIQTDPKPQAFHHQSLYYLNSDIVCKVCVAFQILYIISWTCLHVHYNDDWFSIAQSQPSASAPISQDSSPSARSRCPKGTTFSSSPSSSLSSLPSLHPFPKATRGPSSIPSLNLGGALCPSLWGKS